ncbi:MAG TPA: CBS domain-containing protein [Solirubrobacteraceae bacterium]|nr:CBS domain-containing protein [Solirubrobacteraceae bacterium]
MPNIAIVPLHGSFIAPSFERATVGDAMHPGILTCDRDASRAEIAWIMAAQRVHCVAVMALAQNGSGEPYVWGIVSDLDLLGAAVDPTLEPTAHDLASQPIISVERTAPLREAAGLMHEHRVSHLVVTEAGQPVGILSSLDIAQILAADAVAWEYMATPE